jgi:hypothetical protein
MLRLIIMYIIRCNIRRFDTSDYVIDNVHDILLINKKIELDKGRKKRREFIRLEEKIYTHYYMHMYIIRMMQKKYIKDNVVIKSITFEN